MDIAHVREQSDRERTEVEQIEHAIMVRLAAVVSYYADMDSNPSVIAPR